MAISGSGRGSGVETDAANPGDEAKPGTPGTGENVCPACRGKGKLNDAPCPECGGTGVVIEGIGGG